MQKNHSVKQNKEEIYTMFSGVNYLKSSINTHNQLENDKKNARWKKRSSKSRVSAFSFGRAT